MNDDYPDWCRSTRFCTGKMLEDRRNSGVMSKQVKGLRAIII